ncbi:hypothetical protein R1flu_004483 [Riccia fluitans]|uniref:Uncharacterized protein n=1 Tax=Riccia fluitans TaxID=41844 RepID=A0ABD1YQE8_9MARC
MKKANVGRAGAHGKLMHQAAGNARSRSTRVPFQELKDPTTCQEAFVVVLKLVTNGGTGPERKDVLFHAVKYMASRPKLFSNEQFSTLANQAMLNEIFSEEQKKLISEMNRTRLRFRTKGAKAKVKVEVEDVGCTSSSTLFQQLKDSNTCQEAYEMVLKLVTNGVPSKVDLFNARKVIASKPEYFSYEQLSIIASQALQNKTFSENQRKLFCEMKKESAGPVPAEAEARVSVGNEPKVHESSTDPKSIDQAATVCDRANLELFRQLKDPATCHKAYKMVLKLVADGGSVPGSKGDLFNAVTVIASKPELFSSEQFSIIADRALLNETFTNNQKTLLSGMKNQNLERSRREDTVSGEGEVELRAVEKAAIDRAPIQSKPIDQAEHASDRSNSLQVKLDAKKETAHNRAAVSAYLLSHDEGGCSNFNSTLYQELKEPNTCQQAGSTVLKKLLEKERNLFSDLKKEGLGPVRTNSPLFAQSVTKSTVDKEATIEVGSTETLSLPIYQAEAEDSSSRSSSVLLRKLKDPTTCQEAFKTVTEQLINARAVCEVRTDIFNALKVIGSNRNLFTRDQITTLADCALLNKMFSRREKAWISELLAKTLAEVNINEVSSELEEHSGAVLKKTASHHLPQPPVVLSSQRNATTEGSCNASYRFEGWWEFMANFCSICGRSSSSNVLV